MSPVLLAFSLSIVGFILYQLSHMGRRPKGYPPGPPTIPILGNLHLIPKKKPHLQFKKWADEYGPVYSLILGSHVMIVLTSDQAIKDLLDKRSGIYSSRPEMYLADIISGGLRFLLMPYGEPWRMIRRVIQNNLNITASKSYVPYQDLENKQMLMGFLEKPDQFIDHIRRFTNSLTTQMIFGFRTTSIDDPKLIQLYHGFEKFSNMITASNSTFVNIFPALKMLPDFMFPIRRKAKQWHLQEKKLYVGHWMNAKRGISNGTANPSFCVDLVKAQEAEGFSDDLAAYISGSLLEAGSDTTSTTIVGFVQAMVVFPDVARKAQEDIDRVCGDRLPTMDDEYDLPYIRACVKETMRWMPTDILGVPHAVIKDDEYMGYHIPKGAGVMWNVWGIHNDARRHPEPRRFNPLRYINDTQTAAEAASNPDGSKRDHYVFGAGRRKCQGMHIAERSLFLAISRLLWAFDFHKALDASGNEITPDIDDLTEGTFVMPTPFPARIVPRSEKKATQVREEWMKMEPLLDGEKQWKKIPTGMFGMGAVSNGKRAVNGER